MPDDVTLPNVRLYYLEGKWRLCGHNRKPLVHAKTGTPVDGGGHLFKAKEYLAYTLASVHNLAFYLWLVREARQHILAGDFASWKAEMVVRLRQKC
jgi:hypothetical protein